MATKTYIDGGKQAITFNNDTRPVAVYVDGDLQENVSFVPDVVQGTGSVEYTSEYKKNHIEYEVQGTTIQDGTPTPEAPIPIENANDNGMSAVVQGTQVLPYEPYFRETIEIPTSIDVNGTNVPLLFSEYDKLTVDRLDNKAIYTQGSFTYSYTGEETGTYKLSVVSGNGNNYRSYFEYLNSDWGLKCVAGKCYCTHFKKASWNPLSAYGTYAPQVSNIIFRTDGKQTLDEFKAFLKEQYDNGTPVTFIAQRREPLEHDITNTDLGQALLNLATQNQTNYFEVQSNPNAPQAPINFTFAKWGGRNENNNNT